MSNRFYLKMAADNIRKNGKVYLPFLISCICSVMVSYIMLALSMSRGLGQIPGGNNMQLILTLGNVVISIFFAIFLFYTNSFLMKRRKKEFGVYNILGMDKKHIQKLIMYETMYIASISIVVGLLTGIILNKVCVLVIRRMMDATVSLGFELSPASMIGSSLLFATFFLLLLGYNTYQVHLANPIELLRGGNVGEKEPKTKWIMAVLGSGFLGAGYYLALTIQSPMTGMPLVFLAVLLVIAGTYLLFTAGSIVALKLLRKNSTYYYQIKHFIPVSGMIYRMKKNAVGLANICVMSVGVILLLSIAVSLYVTSDESIHAQYPSNVIAEIKLSGDIPEAEKQVKSELQQAAERTAAETQVEIDSISSYTSLSFPAVLVQGGFDVPEDIYSNQTTKISSLYFIDQNNYNSLFGGNVSLNANEVYLHGTGKEYEGTSLSLMGEQYQATVMKDMKGFVTGQSTVSTIVDIYYIIVNDVEMLQKIEQQQRAIIGKSAGAIHVSARIDLDKETGNEQERNFGNILSGKLEAAGIDVSVVDTRVSAGEKFRALRSGVLFVGMNLGILLLMATVLIIYYKQISEAYDDKDRYSIMRKVGLSLKEIKGVIRSQILTVFFLPLIATGVHAAFTFPLMKKLMVVVMLDSTQWFLYCMAASYTVFAIVYVLIYMVTARAYYKIVS
ncbi:hypothetical protein QW71_02995 [Paenibacillus sp. IHB B 3415]|uniref:ABC transporter permease n=1 Tax=Paenibacillus sp. IHB B 3415 TaxID=867080 RepID=UPI0005749396|nr:ABC transporter permease [Paenibacillus sp. IHB B 3415]KHL97140.1 hypothetical protein QW71_02995 [Paenibacillus sp. IHB B 3415]